MTERVKRLLGLAPRRTGNTLIISSEKLERRVALLENGVLEEYSIERQTDRNIVGSIFKGRVKNIEHGLKAMFVDIGFEKNAFLHFWDALPAALDSGVEQLVVLEPFAQQFQAQRELTSPCAMLVKLIVERSSQVSPHRASI